MLSNIQPAVRRGLPVSLGLLAAIASVVAATSACAREPGSPSLAQVVPQSRAQAMSQTLSATGRGEVSVPATLARVDLGVEVRAASVEAARAEAARRSQAVVDLLESRQVDRLTTTGLRLNPIYRDRDGRPEVVEFVAVNTVSFEVPVEDAGAVVDGAIAAGATRVDGIGFSASDAAIAEARQEALKLAVQDAQQQAEAVLDALNLTQRGIASIQINDASFPQPRPLAAMEGVRSDAATPVRGGEQTIAATVTLQIQY